MIDDELQVLGVETQKKKQRKWLFGTLGFMAGIAVVAIVSLVVRFAIMDSGEGQGLKDNPRASGYTTIVPDLQHAVDSLLNDMLATIDGLQGQAIVMKVQTGDILAMAGRERNFEGKYQPCNNFAYQQVMGTLNHTVSILTALETGKVNLSDMVDTGNGIWDAGKGWIMEDYNWRRGGYGIITLDRAMEISSNIGISKTIWKVFKGHEQDFFNMLDSMSFGKPDSIEGIDGLQPASFDSPKDPEWVDKNVLWSAIGYNQKMTPIQMLTFYNAIANNGKMVKPTLKTGKVEVINPQIASKENISRMQTVLYHVVSQGLGKKAGTELVKVAGKTGTSISNEIEFGEDLYVNEYHVAFCGYFPANAPKYSIIVSMNKLGLPASGGGMAGPVFHDIVEWMVRHKMK